VTTSLADKIGMPKPTVADRRNFLLFHAENTELGDDGQLLPVDRLYTEQLLEEYGHGYTRKTALIAKFIELVNNAYAAKDLIDGGSEFITHELVETFGEDEAREDAKARYLSYVTENLAELVPDPIAAGPATWPVSGADDWPTQVPV
jgi:hypothetical protein